MRFEINSNEGYMLTARNIEDLYRVALEIYELNTEEQIKYYAEKKVELSVTFNQEDTLSCDSIEELQEIENSVDKITDLRIKTNIMRYNCFNIYFSPYGMRYELEVEDKKNYVYFKNKVQKILKGTAQEFPASLINTQKNWVFPLYYFTLAILSSTILSIIPDEKQWIKVTTSLLFIYYGLFPIFLSSKLFPRNIFLIQLDNCSWTRLRNAVIFSI